MVTLTFVSAWASAAAARTVMRRTVTIFFIQISFHAFHLYTTNSKFSADLFCSGYKPSKKPPFGTSALYILLSMLGRDWPVCLI
jgi:hypothetical protein